VETRRRSVRAGSAQHVVSPARTEPLGAQQPRPIAPGPFGRCQRRASACWGRDTCGKSAWRARPLSASGGALSGLLPTWSLGRFRTTANTETHTPRLACECGIPQWSGPEEPAGRKSRLELIPRLRLRGRQHLQHGGVVADVLERVSAARGHEHELLRGQRRRARP